MYFSQIFNIYISVNECSSVWTLRTIHIHSNIKNWKIPDGKSENIKASVSHPFDTRGPEPRAYILSYPRPRGFKLGVFDPFQNNNILYRDFCISQYFTYNIQFILDISTVESFFNDSDASRQSLSLSSFLITEAEAFLLGTEAFLLETEAFLLETEAFLLETEAFFLETEAFFLEPEAFLLEAEAFLLKTEVRLLS